VPPRHLLLSSLLAAAVLAAGCGSSGEGSGYGSGSGDSTGGSPTATATAPDAPPGASARTCEAAVAGTTELRVTGTGCDAGMRVAAAWAGDPSCSAPAGGSRFSCSVEGGYRCLGASAERGVAVSCARRGASVSFVSRPG
jgi:hypothetical protein